MAPGVERRNAGLYRCGLAKWHPEWLQRFANTKTFMLVYGLLGTIQAMSYMYFIVTLTTIEKRFKIPSQTTGIILSGNEISQILFSLILSYIGGQRNRPRWIAWGVVFCGLSCYILALPHVIYGPGDDALRLTEEFYEANQTNGTDIINLVNATVKNSRGRLCGSLKTTDECESLLSIVPLVLIFLSQFVLGIGNTLYYALGQTYLDDNTKKSNTPLMLSSAMALRMIGPIFGFLLSYISLNVYIDPSKTPLIDNKDPRWLGAWWLGWMFLGTALILFSGLIGLFPKQLPKKRQVQYNSHTPHVLRHDELQVNETLPLGSAFSSNVALDTAPATSELPKIKDFPTALMRLLRNKLLIYNITSGIFYILGAAGYMTFLTRYMEVQFHKSAQEAAIVTGPLTIFGMFLGLLGSGIIISKKKPRASYVLLWNVFVGLIYMFGQMSYLFMYCGDSETMFVDGKLNLTTKCNADCVCDGVAYSPVCHKESETTYFSACHAGCYSWNPEEKFYSNCSCVATTSPPSSVLPMTTPYTAYQPEMTTTQSRKKKLPKLKVLDVTKSSFTTLAAPQTLGVQLPLSTFMAEYSTTPTTTVTEENTSFPSTENNDDMFDSLTILVSRSRRANTDFKDQLQPGVCLKGCNMVFYSFAVASMIVNLFGASGRIGNILVNYRAVATEDKAFAQGLCLMLISLFALIPGPILFGRLIDSSCLLWTQTCNGKGNCQLYDQEKFRYVVNIMAFSLTGIGVFFDALVWYNGRGLDLYGEKEAKRLEEMRRRNMPITPLMARSK